VRFDVALKLVLAPLLGAQQILALAGVGFCLSHPLAQHLVVDAQVARDLGDRTA